MLLGAVAAPEPDRGADVCVRGERRDRGRDGDLGAVDVVVDGCGGGEEGPDARVRAVCADEVVGDDDEAVGEGQLVLAGAGAVVERAHGDEGVVPLDRSFWDGGEQDLAEDAAVDLGAGLCLVRHVVLGAAGEDDTRLAADAVLLPFEAGVLLE